MSRESDFSKAIVGSKIIHKDGRIGTWIMVRSGLSFDQNDWYVEAKFAGSREEIYCQNGTWYPDGKEVLIWLYDDIKSEEDENI